MSEEEKNAIEKLKNGKTINIYTLLRTLKKEGIENFVITRKQYIQTVLNLIQSQQEEIEKKDKIIDLQINFLYKLGTDRPGTVFKKLWDEGLNAEECGNCRDDNKKCVECIKQYFEKKVEGK